MLTVLMAKITGNQNITIMNTLISLCLAAVLVASAYAEGYDPLPHAGGAGYVAPSKDAYESSKYGLPPKDGYDKPKYIEPSNDGYGKPKYIEPSKDGYGKPKYIEPSKDSYGKTGYVDPFKAGYDKDGYSDTGPKVGTSYSGDPKGNDYKTGGYGSDYGHGSRDSYGYAGYGHGSKGFGGFRHHGRVASIRVTEKPLTILDKLFERVKDVQDQIKTYSEQVEALSALLANQEKKVKELVLVILVELKETDLRQNEAIDKVKYHLFDIGQDNATLHDHIYKLHDLNENNANKQNEAQTLLAKEISTDVRQDRTINTLYRSIRDLKTKLFQVKANKFEVFYDTVERDTTLLGSIKNRESRRMCEAGQVTLDADDRKSEYQYQNWFDNVPQIIWGLAGFNFDLDTREDPAHYGYGYPPKEPEAIGVNVKAYSTKTGINLEVFDLSFGDTGLVSVDVAFQACTIGPGTDPINH